VFLLKEVNRMPETIHSAHAVFTLIASGILFGLGLGLIWQALQYPWKDSRVGGGAIIICILLVLVAWLVP
jgi:hypothetical protein